ncbi:striatin-like isoform X2 [Vanacampus margaritifer]
MDEQAGPAVLLGLAGGGGAAKAPQPGDGEAARAHYSIPGILHFLQHEWARYEVDRAQWDVERSELQAQIAFLQGERRGHHNLKKDLLRRIGMLEYALKQERSKHHKLKYGTELIQGDVKAPSYDSDEANDVDAPLNSSHQLSWKQGRQLLTQYLQEVGYTDAILDVKSRRVRVLLGLDADGEETAETCDVASDREHVVGSTRGGVARADSSHSAAIFEAFKLIENAAAAAADFSDEDEEDSGDEGPDTSVLDMVRRKQSSPTPSSTTSELSDDPDTEEALKGFDFLSGQDAHGGEDASQWDKETEVAWDVDAGVIAQLKEEYRRERRGKKGIKRPNRSKLQDMLANLRDGEELLAMQTSATPTTRPTFAGRLNEQEVEEGAAFLPSPGKSFLLGRVDEAAAGELALGELAGLTVANEADGLTYQTSNSQDALRKTWNAKFTLRSHFDALRGLAFHPVEPVLVTASDDGTLKLWNLDKSAPAKKCASVDVEPVYTFRAHSGAVLCVTMSGSGEQCFSGGVDGTIQCWNLPGHNSDPYDPYERSVQRGVLHGHTDAVWGVAYSSAHQRLLSCSADGTVRLWNAGDVSPSLAVFNRRGELGVPTSVDVSSSEPAHAVASFAGGHLGVFDMETQQLLLKMESAGASDAPRQINKVLSHPTLPVSITAQEDRHIRFFDNNTGKLAHSMVAHLDAVTSLAADPNGIYLMSGSDDCSVRVWNLASKTCVQEFTAHRKKFDESIQDVSFHPAKCYIASAGADALAKVFV